MPPPLTTPTRLQTLRNQTLKLHLPGSGRNYISLPSGGCGLCTDSLVCLEGSGVTSSWFVACRWFWQSECKWGGGQQQQEGGWRGRRGGRRGGVQRRGRGRGAETGGQATAEGLHSWPEGVCAKECELCTYMGYCHSGSCIAGEPCTVVILSEPTAPRCLMRVCVHACMYVYACLCACMRVCVHVCMYACMCACMFICVCACMCVYVHA